MSDTRLYSWLDFHDDARDLLEWLRIDQIEVTAVIGIPRGGLVLATVMAHALAVPLHVRSFPESQDQASTLVCDDTTLTGGSLAPFLRRGMPCAVLVKHPGAIVCSPFYYARETDEAFLFPWEAEAPHVDALALEDIVAHNCDAPDETQE